MGHVHVEGSVPSICDLKAEISTKWYRFVPKKACFSLCCAVCKYTWCARDSRSLVVSFQVFHDVAYKARNRDDLLAGVDEFLDKVTVLPPGEWDPNIRLEPPPEVRGDSFPGSAFGGVANMQILCSELYV